MMTRPCPRAPKPSDRCLLRQSGTFSTRTLLVSGTYSVAKPMWPRRLPSCVVIKLARGVRQQRLTAADAKSALAGFLFLAPPEVSVHDRMDDALELALQERFSAFDALFLIVARDLNWPLVTDDRALSERANRLGIPCQTLDTLSS